MIGYLNGTVFEKMTNPILVSVGGVGYAVYVPQKLILSLAANSQCQLYVHTYIKEDVFDLYGFSDKKELGLFRLLLGVSGIGPKTALTIVDKGVNPVQQAVMQADTDFFMTIPRLGKKNAQKIIIDLKTKLGSITELDLQGKQDTDTQDVLQALVSMGFTKNESITALNRIPDTAVSIEEKIKLALKYIHQKQ